MDATIVGIIGAGIGAAGAVAAQVVSQIFTGRRDSRKLTWEQSRQFIDIRRAIYVRYTALMMRRHDAHQKLAFYEADQPEYLALLEEVTESSASYWAEVREIKAEIALLSPVLSATADDLHGVVVNDEFTLVDAGEDDDPQVLNERFSDALYKLHVAMRADLGVAERKKAMRDDLGVLSPAHVKEIGG